MSKSKDTKGKRVIYGLFKQRYSFFTLTVYSVGCYLIAKELGGYVICAMIISWFIQIKYEIKNESDLV